MTVSEHEKEIEIPTPIDFKPREDWKTRLERLEEVDRESHDSLDEYGGEGAYFTEDGSFVGEITDHNRKSTHEEGHDPVV